MIAKATGLSVGTVHGVIVEHRIDDRTGAGAHDRGRGRALVGDYEP